MSSDEPQEIRATCLDCRAVFTIPGDEQLRLQEIARERGWDFCLPTRCRACRRQRRGEPPHPEWKPTNQHLALKCATCGASFMFGPEAQRYYASQGFALPRSCKPCRDWRASSQGSGAW